MPHSPQYISDEIDVGSWVCYWARNGLATAGDGAQYPMANVFRMQNSSALQSALAVQRPGRSSQRAAGRSGPRFFIRPLHSVPSGQDAVGPSSRKSLHLSPGFSGGGRTGGGTCRVEEHPRNADMATTSAPRLIWPGCC
jgi:hypothetical protein